MDQNCAGVEAKAVLYRTYLCEFWELSVQIYARIVRIDHNIVLFFVFNGTERYVFFCHETFIFKMVLLCVYYELEGPPHHCSDVFCHGESIFDSAASVWALYRSIPWAQCCKARTKTMKISCNSMKINKIQ